MNMMKVTSVTYNYWPFHSTSDVSNVGISFLVSEDNIHNASHLSLKTIDETFSSEYAHHMYHNVYEACKDES